MQVRLPGATSSSMCMTECVSIAREDGGGGGGG